VVDSVRYAKVAASGERPPEWVDRAAVRLADMVNSAYAVWGVAAVIAPDEVASALRVRNVP
jgi:hypothetical protein